MSFFECKRCGGIPGVTGCCSDTRDTPSSKQESPSASDKTLLTVADSKKRILDAAISWAEQREAGPDEATESWSALEREVETELERHARQEASALETLEKLWDFLGMDPAEEKARPGYNPNGPLSETFIAALERRISVARGQAT